MIWVQIPLPETCYLLIMRLIKYISIFNSIYEFFFSYPAPSNLNYFWNFGIYSILCLIIQILTGIFLAMHYISDQTLAFNSIEHIMRDVNLGWLIRYSHANGASMFFIVVYVHILRGLYFSSYMYPRENLWIVGMIIFIIMILTAFLGYVLPRGQMSFWAATVITNLVSAIPLIGQNLVIWLWGGYAVDNATLIRFFSLHYLFPFILVGLVLIHLIFLHEFGSNNPIGVEFKYIDHITMYPYYILKDFFGVLIFLIFFTSFIFFNPNLLGHTDNYIQANSMVTPTHIVPEWYFLIFYTILRSIPDKLFGVLGMFFPIILLLLLPYFIIPKVKSLLFRPYSRLFFWFFFFICLGLGWIGSKPANYPYVYIGQLLTISYFLIWLFFFPILIKIEGFFWMNISSISYKNIKRN